MDKPVRATGFIVLASACSAFGTSYWGVVRPSVEHWAQSAALNQIAFIATVFAPLAGAIVLGKVADSAGRQSALRLALAIAGLSLTGLSLAYILPARGANTLIVLLQGFLIFANAGLAATAAAWLFELAPPSRETIHVALRSAAAHFATACASIAMIAMIAVFGRHQSTAWYWLLAAAAIPPLLLAFVMPKNVDETFVVDAPLSYRGHWRIIIAGLFAFVFGVIATMVAGIMLTNMKPGIAPDLDQAVPLLVAVTTLLGSLAGGWICDRFGRRKVMLGAGAAATICAFVFLFAFNHPSPAIAITACLALSFLNAMVWVATMVSVIAALPARMRVHVPAMLIALAGITPVLLFGKGGGMMTNGDVMDLGLVMLVGLYAMSRFPTAAEMELAS